MSNSGPANSSVVNTQPIVGSFDANGNLITAYGPAGVPIQFTGPVVGTTTNDSAATGVVGEYISASTTGGTHTVTITIAAPGVITWTAHGLGVGSMVTFTTTGALPTGLTAGTAYFVVSVPDANTFTVSATAGGTAITTTGTQSGTQTATSSVTLSTGVAVNAAAISLTAGDWDVFGIAAFHSASGTTVPNDVKQGISSTSATLGAIGTYSYDYVAVAITDDPFYVAPVTRISISSTTTIYLVVMSDFSVSTLTTYGFIRARRMR